MGGFLKLFEILMKIFHADKKRINCHEIADLDTVADGGSDVIFNTLLTHNWGNIVYNSHNFKSISS